MPIKEANKTDGKINVGLVSRDENGVEMFEFVVENNGISISDENLSRIFERGFSTKETGHSGVGLHWCANTLNAAGGSIYVENSADETGACFHVLMPTSK